MEIREWWFAVLMIVAFAFCFGIGATFASAGIVNDCRLLGRFHYKDKVYVCKAQGEAASRE